MTARTTNIRAMRYVTYRDIPHYLAMGWIAPEPAHFSRLNYFGIEMLWLCDCNIPDKRI
jgi:hypothetical protein